MGHTFAFSALRWAWEQAKRRMPSQKRSEEKALCAEFRQCVLRFWPAFHASGKTADVLQAMGPVDSAHYFRALALGNQADEAQGPVQLFAPFHIKETALAAPVDMDALGSKDAAGGGRHGTDSDDVDSDESRSVTDHAGKPRGKRKSRKSKGRKSPRQTPRRGHGKAAANDSSEAQSGSDSSNSGDDDHD